MLEILPGAEYLYLGNYGIIRLKSCRFSTRIYGSMSSLFWRVEGEFKFQEIPTLGKVDPTT